ncbi:glycosyltransferase [Planktomarina temperata]|nr:glycosyltransferase [Planktomarina temperata]
MSNSKQKKTNFWVGITHYNEVDNLLLLLTFISKNTIIPTKVIIIDDCSVDINFLISETQAFSGLFELLVLQNDVNFGGPALGRNRCLNLAYENNINIFLFDADDLPSRSFFQNSLSSAETMPNFPVYSPRRINFNSNLELSRIQNLISDFPQRVKIDASTMLSWGINPFTMSGTLFSKKNQGVNPIFFDETCSPGIEDLHLWLKLSDYNQIKLLQHEFVYYRKSKGQLSSNKVKHGIKVVSLFYTERRSSFQFLKRFIGYTVWHLLFKHFVRS